MILLEWIPKPVDSPQVICDHAVFWRIWWNCMIGSLLINCYGVGLLQPLQSDVGQAVHRRGCFWQDIVQWHCRFFSFQHCSSWKTWISCESERILIWVTLQFLDWDQRDIVVRKILFVVFFYFLFWNIFKGSSINKFFQRIFKKLNFFVLLKWFESSFCNGSSLIFIGQMRRKQLFERVSRCWQIMSGYLLVLLVKLHWLSYQMNFSLLLNWERLCH